MGGGGSAVEIFHIRLSGEALREAGIKKGSRLGSSLGKLTSEAQRYDAPKGRKMTVDWFRTPQ